VDFLLGGVSGIIRTMSKVLSGFSFTRNLSADINRLAPYFQKVNVFMPMDDGLAVLGLFISVNLALAAYYWITRAINLIRGAG